jgi:hypothetical protein
MSEPAPVIPAAAPVPEQTSFAGTEVRCPKCDSPLCAVSPVVRLNMTVHCSFCGHDFGVALEPEAKS